MTSSGSRAEYARKANSPWRGNGMVRKVPVKLGGDGQNASKQRKALSRMSVLELETGMTEAEHDRMHAAQRARVFARYGVTP